MTVEQLIEKLVTLGPSCAKYTVDARVTRHDILAPLPDFYVDDMFTLEYGDGYLTLLLGDPS